MKILVSAIIALIASAFCVVAFKLPFVDGLVVFTESFLLFWVLIFAILTFKEQLYLRSGQPFRNFSLLSAASLLISLGALLESRHNTVACFSFLPFVILFLGVAVRSYLLMLRHQRAATKNEPKWKDWQLFDKALSILFFVGFFLFLFLTGYYLGWFPA